MKSVVFALMLAFGTVACAKEEPKKEEPNKEFCSDSQPMKMRS